MAKTTGPILAIGAITVGNAVILNNKEIDWRVPIATGIAAGVFALFERVFPEGAVMLSYVALVSVLFTRLEPGVPAPVESLTKFLGK